MIREEAGGNRRGGRRVHEEDAALSKLARGHPGGKAGTLKPGLVVGPCPLSSPNRPELAGREGGQLGGWELQWGAGDRWREEKGLLLPHRAVSSVDWLRNGGQGQHL